MNIQLFFLCLKHCNYVIYVLNTEKNPIHLKNFHKSKLNKLKNY